MSLRNVSEVKAPRLSLAWRLTALYAISSWAIMGIFVAILYSAVQVAFEREADEFLVDKLHAVTDSFAGKNVQIAEIQRDLRLDSTTRRYVRGYIRVQKEDGTILGETPGMDRLVPPELFPKPGDAENPPPGISIDNTEGNQFRVLAVRAGNVLVQVACDREHEHDILETFRWYMVILGTLAIIATAAMSYSVAQGGIRPVREITRTARQIRTSTLHERLEQRSLPRELHELAGTFNDMLDRLEDSFLRLSRFSADIAHELRTPVNNLRVEAEVAISRPRSTQEYKEVLGSVLEECDRLSRIIDQLLFIARAENLNQRPELHDLDVANELGKIAEFYEAVALEAGVTLKVEAPDLLRVRANRELFRGAVGNLVSNAIAYTPKGGAVTLAAESRDSEFCIAVADTGAGIPVDAIPKIFDRFYRVDPARAKTLGGTGLGLAIVKSIVQLHRGRIDVQSALGRGTRIALYFPNSGAAPAPAPSPARVTT